MEEDGSFYTDEDNNGEEAPNNRMLAFGEVLFPEYPHAFSQTPPDPLLDIFKDFAEQILKTPETFIFNNEISSELQTQIFGDVSLEVVQQNLDKLDLSLNTVCGKFISEGGIFFRCLDCDLLKQKNSYVYSLLCPECFENSNHAGHRILYESSDAGSSPICDCGDPYSLRETGFCSKHRDNVIDPQSILNKFPKQSLDQCLLSLKKAFYGVISLYELAIVGPPEVEDRNRFHDLAGILLADIMTICEDLYSGVNSCFLIVLGAVFSSTFPEGFSLVWHTCNDTQNAGNNWSLNPTEPHPCTCSILDNLLRLANVIDRDNQGTIHKVLIECAKEPSFKLYLQERFIKFLPYLYSQGYTFNETEDKVNSRLLTMKVQLFGSEELCFSGLKSEYMNNHMYCLKRVISNSFAMNYEVYHTCIDLGVGMGYFLNEKFNTGKLTIEKLNLFEEVLGIMAHFQVKFFYTEKIHFGLFAHNIDFISLNCGLMTSRAISDLFENGVRAAFKLGSQEKANFTRQILDIWTSHFETVKSVIEKEEALVAIMFNCVFERAIAFLIRYSIGGIDSLKLKGFLDTYLPKVEPAKFAVKVVESIVKSFGKIRYIHLIHNYSQGELHTVYYFSNNLFFETDIVFMQTMLLLINKEDMFDVLMKNYFSYSNDVVEFFCEPQSFQKDERWKEKMKLMEDFMDLIIFLMTDESCLLNTGFEEKEQGVVNKEFSERANRVFKRVVTSLLSAHYWVEGNTLKKEIKDFLFIKEKEVEVVKIYNEIAVIDKKNKKLRIKEDQIPNFDPYVLYRKPSTMKKASAEVFQKGNKAEAVADVVGGQSYPQYPVYLEEIQRKMFQSGLMEFILKFVDQFKPEFSPLLRPCLKIILLYLEYIKREYKSSAVINQDKFAQVYVGNEFAKKLGEVVENSGLKDCQPCLQKINNLALALMKKQESPEKMKDEAGSPLKESADDKKKIAELKMKALKEEYMKKQQMFLSKIQSGSEAADNKLEEEGYQPAQNEAHKNVICQHCLEPIDVHNELYGAPVFLCFSNNMYMMSGSHGKMSEKPCFDVFPVVSSCLHYYHKKCFSVFFDNSKKNNGVATILQPHESLCPMCRQIFNAFLPFSQIKAEQQLKNSKYYSEEVDNKEVNAFYSFEDAFEKLALEWLMYVLKVNGVQENPLHTLLDLLQRLVFRILDESSKIEDQEKFIRFFVLHRKVLSCLLNRLETKPLEDCLSLFETLSKEWKQFNSDHELMTALVLRILASKKTDKQEAIKHVIAEYCLFKTLKHKRETYVQIPGTMKLLQELGEEDFENPVIMPNLISCLTKLQVFQEIIKDEDHFFEGKIRNLFSLNHNNDILMFQIKDFFGFCKEKLLHSQQILPHIEVVMSNQALLDQIVTCGFAPRMIKLPKSLAEFNTIYSKKKCSKCKEFSRHLLTSLCLICGDTICQSSCPATPQVLGNLNYHAIKEHAGIAIFLDIQYPVVVIVSTPEGWVSPFKDVYNDFLGENIINSLDDHANLYDIDFNNFNLNEEFENHIKEVIQEHSMKKELYNVAQNQGMYYKAAEL